MGYHDIDALISQLQMFYKDVSSGKYGICIGPQDPNNPNCFPVHGGYVGIADESQQISRPEPVRDWLESMLGVIQYRQSSQISFGPLLIQCAKILACIKNEGNSLIWQTPSDRTNNYGIYLTSMMFINPFLSVQGPRDEENKSINAAKLDALPDGMKKTAMRRIETPIPAGAPAFVQPLINGSFDPLYAFPLVYVDYEHRSRSGEDSACLLFNPDKLNRLISKNSKDLMPLYTVDPATQTSFLPLSAVYDYEGAEDSIDWPWACNTFVGEALFFALLVKSNSAAADFSYDDDTFRQNQNMKTKYLQKCFRIHRQLCRRDLISSKNRYETTIPLYKALCRLVGRSKNSAPFSDRSFTSQQYLEELRKDFGLCSSGPRHIPDSSDAYIMFLGCEDGDQIPHHVEIVTRVEVASLSPSVLKQKEMTTLISCTSIGAHDAGAFEQEYLIRANRSGAEVLYRNPNSTDPSFGTYAYSHARFFKIDSSVLDKLLGRA